jgi:hypothetical protein
MFAEVNPGFSIADLELGLFLITVLLFGITAWLAHLTKQNVNLTEQNVLAAKQSINLTEQNVDAAKQNVKAVKELIEFLTDPLVFIDAQWEDRMVQGEQHLVVKVFMKNRGGGPARDIEIVDVKNDFPVKMGVNTFTEEKIVKSGIKELAPFQDMLLTRLLVDGAWRECPSPEIFFKYKTEKGKERSNSSIIPFPALATVYSATPYR